MKCGTCHAETARIKIYAGHEYCSQCSDMSEAGGSLTDGILTRNSLRVRTESVKYEGDFLTSHKYDKAQKRVIPNEEFIVLHPDQATNYYTDEEMGQNNLRKLATHKKHLAKQSADHKARMNVEHVGDKTTAIKKLVGK